MACPSPACPSLAGPGHQPRGAGPLRPPGGHAWPGASAVARQPGSCTAREGKALSGARGGAIPGRACQLGTRSGAGPPTTEEQGRQAWPQLTRGFLGSPSDRGIAREQVALVWLPLQENKDLTPI